MPLGVKEILVSKTQKKVTNAKSAAMRLLKLEQELYSDNALKRKRKRKKIKQLTEDESDQFSEEENIDDFNDEDNVKEEDEAKPLQKKKKVQRNDNLTQTNSQALCTDVSDSSKAPNKSKEKDNDTCKINVQNGNCALTRNPLPLIKNGIDCKKMKLKRKKATTANTLDFVTSVKKKKTPKLKICGEWDVSDNTVSSIPASLNGEGKELRVNTVEKTVTNDTAQKNDVAEEQPTWLAPIFKKIENEKNGSCIAKTKTVSLKAQYKISSNLNSKKRVKIALQRNTAQHTSEYIRQIRKSPSIPFDANRKPLAGVLKASPIPSPINPFYKKNIK